MDRSVNEASEARAALPADADAFGQLLEQHRRDLVVLCYRFLGSLHDAEDAAQETALNAWRGRATYRGEAGLRTWLHRIATRVCLDMLARRQRRLLPTGTARPADPASPPEPPTAEIPWLEPLPDTYVVDSSLDPASRYSLRESVSLAFVAALQLLPPRQRAVLLLRDVLAWRAAEVAQALDITVSAANSALSRARTRMGSTMQLHDPASVSPVRRMQPSDRRLLDAYMRAWETDDVDALVATLREEVRLAMPPSPSWYEGRSDVAELVRRWVLPKGPFRMRPTGANMQTAAVLLAVAPDGVEKPWGIHVLTIRGGRIAAIDAFMNPAVAARF